MVDKRIVNYIRNGLQKGYSIEALRSSLLRQGWSPEDIQESVDITRGIKLPISRKRAAAQTYQEMGVAKKIKKVLISPTELFQNVKYESDIDNSLKYLAVILIVPSAVLAVLTIAFASYLPLFFAFVPISEIQLFGSLLAAIGVVLVLIFYIFGLILSFSQAGVLHIIGLIAGVKAGYSNTYKASVYASTPILLLGWMALFSLSLGSLWGIIIVGLVFAIWTIFLTSKGLSILHDISMKRALGIVLIPIIIVVLLFLLPFLLFPAAIGPGDFNLTV